MAYQKCPVCNGSGKGFPSPNFISPQCRPCSGTGIIDELTGAPPRYNRELVSAVSRDYEKQFHEACRKFEQYGDGDFRDRPMETQFDK